MNEESHFSSIENRLRAEAGRLLVDGQRPATQLWNEYQCRRRRTAQRRWAAAVSAVMLAAIVSGIVRNQQPLQPQPQAVAASHAPSDSQDAAAVLRTATVEAPSSSAVAIPFVIGDPESGEPTITGFYVPEEIQPIDLRELSPVERDAVNAVLELDPGQANGGVI